MRTKDTRRWVDRMEKAAQRDLENPVSAKRKKLSPDILGNGQMGDVLPLSSPIFEQVNMAVVHDASDLNAPSARDGVPKFPYKPLDERRLEIRVVTLKSGPLSSAIECSLQHVPTKRGSRPSYKALSYTWGSPEIQKTVLLDGIRVKVRENLWQALYHLRSEEAPVHLWIDAICINQDDIPERNQQVSRMGTLYGMAEEVLIWLGPEGHGSTQALTFIEKSMGSRETASQSLFRLEPPSQEIQIIESVTNLMIRDYWSRAWIIQEIFRARKLYVYCGHKRVPWTLLAKFFREIEKHADELETTRVFLPELRQSLAARFAKQRSAQDLDLDTLLRTYKSSLCSDRRDKVYSLLGLARRRIVPMGRMLSKSDWINVDYSKSAQELFESLAVLYYDQVIGYGKLLADTMEEATDGQVAFLQVQKMQMLQEILGIQPVWEGNQYIIQGSAAGVKASFSYETSQTFRCSTKYHNVVARVSPTWEYGRNRDNILNWYSQFHGDDMPSISEVGSALVNVSEQDKARLNSSHFARWKPRMNDTNEALATMPPDIRLFTTHNGRLGLTTCEIVPGDRVARFEGCDVALLLPNFKDLVKGRAFIVKVERSRGMGLSVADAATFRYGTPDVLDDPIHDLKDADVNPIQLNRKPGIPSDCEPIISLTLTLEEWQAATW